MIIVQGHGTEYDFINKSKFNLRIKNRRKAMPDVATVLKAEIARISRKEAKAITQDIRKAQISLKKTVVDLKRGIAELKQEIKLLSIDLKSTEQEPESSPVPVVKHRITAKRINNTRKKLRLSQVNFAKLAGVTPNTIHNWESKKGILKLRNKTMEDLLSVMKMGISDAKMKLAELKKTKDHKRKGKKK